MARASTRLQETPNNLNLSLEAAPHTNPDDAMPALQASPNTRPYTERAPAHNLGPTLPVMPSSVDPRDSINMLVEAARTTSPGSFGVELSPHGYAAGVSVSTEGNMGDEEWMSWVDFDKSDININHIVLEIDKSTT